VLFFAVALKRRALTPAIGQYFFADDARVLIMFWHIFGQGGAAPFLSSLKGTILYGKLYIINNNNNNNFNSLP
jgi:hypothetical protein